MKIGEFNKLTIKKNKTLVTEKINIGNTDGVLKIAITIPSKYKDIALNINYELGVRKEIWLKTIDIQPVNISSIYNCFELALPPIEFIRFLIENKGKKLTIWKFELYDYQKEKSAAFKDNYPTDFPKSPLSKLLVKINKERAE